MKYLWFSSDSDCPPYFGPLAKMEGLHPRNPFFQAPSLDYDHLFDEGWEEEPDGESLSVRLNRRRHREQTVLLCRRKRTTTMISVH